MFGEEIYGTLNTLPTVCPICGGRMMVYGRHKMHGEDEYEGKCSKCFYQTQNKYNSIEDLISEVEGKRKRVIYDTAQEKVSKNETIIDRIYDGLISAVEKIGLGADYFKDYYWNDKKGK